MISAAFARANWNISYTNCSFSLSFAFVASHRSFLSCTTIIIVINFVVFFFRFPLLSCPVPRVGVYIIMCIYNIMYIRFRALQPSLGGSYTTTTTSTTTMTTMNEPPGYPPTENTWQFNDSDSPTRYIPTYTSTTVYTTPPLYEYYILYYRCHVYLTTMTLTIFLACGKYNIL